MAKEKDETKYGSYILTNPTRDLVFNMKAFMLDGEKDFGGLPFPLSFGLSSYPQPFDVYQQSHAHDFDQLLCFIGGNPMNLSYLGAEIDLSLGEEQEKHTITEPSIVYVPKGMHHCPLNYRVVHQPFMCLDIFISPKYEQKKTS